VKLAAMQSPSATTAHDQGEPTRIEFGAGRLDEIAAIARETVAEHRGGRDVRRALRAFVVTDSGVRAAGHAERAIARLGEAGFGVEVFDGCVENPTADDVAACRRALGTFVPDVLVAIGGGSCIDTAKGCAFVLAGGGSMADYVGFGRARGDLVPLVAVPTTAGTGSEVQSFALIGRSDGSHMKMACGDPRARPRVALLDPELARTMPVGVTACSGLDTLVHAVETAVTTARTDTSGGNAVAAFALVDRHLERCLEQPDDLDARGGMMRASALAGSAIESSMLGAAHALANPLTAHHGVVHGLAVGTMLPHVVAFNRLDGRAAGLYGDLARRSGLCAVTASLEHAVDTVERRVAALLSACVRAAGLPDGLAASGVRERDLPRLAQDAAGQWTGRFNPRPIDAQACEALYRRALGGVAAGEGVE
jgi:alcohol dehydrogenase